MAVSFILHQEFKTIFLLFPCFKGIKKSLAIKQKIFSVQYNNSSNLKQ